MLSVWPSASAQGMGADPHKTSYFGGGLLTKRKNALAEVTADESADNCDDVKSVNESRAGGTDCRA